MLGGICSNCQLLLVVLMCLVDEGEGFVGYALGGVEFHQMLLALQDGVVTAADNLPEIHVAVVVVVVERVVGTEEETDGANSSLFIFHSSLSTPQRYGENRVPSLPFPTTKCANPINRQKSGRGPP